MRFSPSNEAQPQRLLSRLIRSLGIDHLNYLRSTNSSLVHYKCPFQPFSEFLLEGGPGPVWPWNRGLWNVGSLSSSKWCFMPVLLLVVGIMSVKQQLGPLLLRGEAA